MIINEQIKREEIYYRQLMLHYEVYNLKSRKRILEEKENPWHWHDEFEVCLVRGGKIKYKTAVSECLLEEGDVVFINAKTIHAVEPIPPSDDMFLSVHFFDDVFISGGQGNYIDVNYVHPVINNESIDMIVFKKGTAHATKARKLIEENILLKRNKEKFWEFDLRKNTSDFWRMIIDSVETAEAEIKLPSASNDRLRDAISYIQENYKEKITLNDIACYIQISTRGCDRMFMKYLKLSPIMYLHSVRLQKATSMLSDMNKSISEVAIANGYSSSSHFGKIFKEKHNMTPKKYRERLLKINENN